MRPLLVGPLPRDLAEMSAHALHREAARARDAVNAAYWRFTRSTRGPLVPPELYARLTWADEAVRRWYVGGAEAAS